MKTLFLTNEYPPTIYGGAGVHVEYLSRELARLMQVEVCCYGKEHREPRIDTPTLQATGYGFDASGYTAPKNLHSVFGAIQRGLDWNTTRIEADIVHLHTWYTHLAGITAKLNYGLPMVLTVHSIEPLRPWKREQLGGGYDFSCWVEKTAIEMADAVIAVSRETKADIVRLFEVDEARVHIIYNGIDLAEYKPVTTTTSSTPFAASVSSWRSSNDRPANSIRHLGRSWVSCPRRDPWPAERMMAFMESSLARQLRQTFGKPSW